MAFYLLADPIPPLEVVIVFVAMLVTLSIAAALPLMVPRLVRATALSVLGAVGLALPAFYFCCTCFWCWY